MTCAGGCWDEMKQIQADRAAAIRAHVEQTNPGLRRDRAPMIPAEASSVPVERAVEVESPQVTPEPVAAVTEALSAPEEAPAEETEKPAPKAKAAPKAKKDAEAAAE